MNEDTLNALSYRDLQKRAKANGVKANQPKEALIRALMSQASQTESAIPETDDETSILTEDGVASEDDAPPPKDAGRPTKRKRFAEFYTAPLVPGAKRQRRSLASTPGSPLKDVIPPKTPDSTPKLNTTITLEDAPGTPTQRRSRSKASTPQALNVTVTLDRPKAKTPTPQASAHKTPLAKRTSIARGSPAPKALAASVKKMPMTPRSVQKMRTSNLLSSRKKSLAANNSSIMDTPGTSTRAPASTSVAKRASVKKTSFQPSQLPRLARKKVPDFAKLHAEQFEKMETLEVYLQKKQERFLKVMTPGKPANPDDKLTRKSPRNVSTSKIATFARTSTAASSASKVPTMKTQPQPKPTAKPVDPVKPAPATTIAPSKPFVFDLKEANFNFGASTLQSGKPFVFKAAPSTPSNKILHNITNNAEGTPGSAKKFDLKASLAKPLGYQPHKGKLKPWDPKVKAEARKAMATQAKVNEDRRETGRALIKGVRLNKRAELLLKRRKLDEN